MYGFTQPPDDLTVIVSPGPLHCKVVHMREVWVLKNPHLFIRSSLLGFLRWDAGITSGRLQEFVVTDNVNSPTMMR